MRFKLFTFMGSWLQTPGMNIELYYSMMPPRTKLFRAYDDMMNRPKVSMGDTGAFVLMSGETPLILVPESSYMFNYDFLQVVSPIRSLARKMPNERAQISALDNELYKMAITAYKKLKDK